MAQTKTPDEVLRALRALQSRQELSILKISEPILSSAPSSQDPNAREDNSGLRTSDASSSSLDALPTPASLEADLAHYRELFAKLRFSYVEQVTKEKFIRAIVGDPPQVVSPAENAALERANAAAKAALKQRKDEVADAIATLEARGRALSRRHEAVAGQAAALEALPGKIDELEARAADLKAAAELEHGRNMNDNPQLALPLPRTLELVAEKKQARLDLDRRLEQLSAQAPRKRKEMERLRAELGPLEARRTNCAAAAKEARRRKEAALGGVEDDLEERGRWWQAADAALRQVLELSA